MARKNGRDRRMAEAMKRVLADFANYENAVVLISSLESWFQHKWGDHGEVPGCLQAFDRFPEIDGLTPDFMARFRTPYVLWGEHKTTFRAGQGGEDDVRQVMDYSAWRANTARPAISPPHDVLLLVDTHSDTKAAKAIQQARRTWPPGKGTLAPIIIVGYYRDRRINGEWFSLKWREHFENCRFSSPNVSRDKADQDLNKVLVEPEQCPIRIDLSAIDGSDRNPLINDTPPAIYTLVRLILPAINELLTDDERDMLRSEGSIDKEMSRQDLMSAPMLRDLQVREKHIQNALDLFVELGQAKPVGADPPRYAIRVDLRAMRDILGWISKKLARNLVNRLVSRRKGGPRRAGDAKGQLPLFDT